MVMATGSGILRTLPARFSPPIGLLVQGTCSELGNRRIKSIDALHRSRQKKGYEMLNAARGIWADMISTATSSRTSFRI